MAQLVEQSLLTPEVRGSNPAIGKIQIERLLSTVLRFEKTKIGKRKKRPERAHLKKESSHVI